MSWKNNERCRVKQGKMEKLKKIGKKMHKNCKHTHAFIYSLIDCWMGISQSSRDSFAFWICFVFGGFKSLRICSIF